MEGITNWKLQLPITNIAPGETFATNVCREMYSVQLCVDRWAKEMILGEKEKTCVLYIFTNV